MSVPSSSSIPIVRRRDVAIDAALRRVLLCTHPDLTEAQIQERGSIEVGSGFYTVQFDGKPFALVELEEDHAFRFTLLK